MKNKNLIYTPLGVPVGEPIIGEDGRRYLRIKKGELYDLIAIEDLLYFIYTQKRQNSLLQNSQKTKQALAEWPIEESRHEYLQVFSANVMSVFYFLGVNMNQIVRNSNGKKICEINPERKTVEIVIKDVKTTIVFTDDGKLIISNSKV